MKRLYLRVLKNLESIIKKRRIKGWGLCMWENNLRKKFERNLVKILGMHCSYTNMIISYYII